MTRASNLAIFAANPPTTNSTALSVSGNLVFSSTGKRITGDFSNATVANRVMFQTSTTNGTTNITAIPNGTATQSNLQLYNGTDTENTGLLSVACSSSEARFNSTIFGTGTYLPMTFITGGSERMRIDAGGNTGIGTSSPTAKLHVVNATGGTAIFAGNANASLYVNYLDGGTNYISGSTTVFRNGAATVEFMRITSAGNMGIGTTSPARKFDVAGGARFLQDTSATTGAIVLRQNSGDTVGGFIQWVDNSNSTEKGWLVVDTSSNMLFATNSTERARITSAGGFVVGTTTDPGAGKIADNIGNVRSVPQNAQTTGYTLVAADNGKHISITTGGVTVPASIFSIGDTVTIFNNSSSSQTITQGSTVTLRQSATTNTGNRTLAGYGICTILCVASNVFVITGSGLT